MDNQQFQPVQNQSIWTIILPTIIITALIVGGGIWYWQKSSFEKEKEDLQQQIEELENQVSEQSQKIENSQTADWKTYQNEDYGFEVKYPKDWTATEKNDNDINFASKTEEMNPLSIIVSTISDTSFDGAEQIMINNINFYKFPHEFGGDSWISVFYTVKEGLTYRISFDESNPNDINFEEHYKIFDQIISTFKFTN